MSSNTDAVKGLEQAAAITKACQAAGITDPSEIPALIRFAHTAERFAAALTAHQRAMRSYNQHVSTHGHDDPGQEYFVAQVAAAQQIYDVTRSEHDVDLLAWRAARGLVDLAAAA